MLNVKVVHVILEPELGLVCRLKTSTEISVFCLMVEEINSCKSLESVRMDFSVTKSLSKSILLEISSRNNKIQDILFMSEICLISDH